MYYSRSSDNLVSRDREISSLRRQLDEVSEELTEKSRSREVALRENRRLQEDLTTMTRENQVCFIGSVLCVYEIVLYIVRLPTLS